VTISTDDLRIRDMQELMTPAQLLADCPRDDVATATVTGSRARVQKIMRA